MPYVAARTLSGLSLQLWISDTISEVLQTRPYTTSCRVVRGFNSPSTGFALLFCLLVRVVRQWCVKTLSLHECRTSSTCTQHNEWFFSCVSTSVWSVFVIVCSFVFKLLSHDPSVCAPPLLLILIHYLLHPAVPR